MTWFIQSPKATITCETLASYMWVLENLRYLPIPSLEGGGQPSNVRIGGFHIGVLYDKMLCLSGCSAGTQEVTQNV
jgi:hypothetical protein